MLLFLENHILTYSKNICHGKNNLYLFNNDFLLLLLTIVHFFPFSIIGASKVKKYRKLILEQAKSTNLELVPEEPSEPVPPLIVDHERLQVCLALDSLFQ